MVCFSVRVSEYVSLLAEVCDGGTDGVALRVCGFSLNVPAEVLDTVVQKRL